MKRIIKNKVYDTKTAIKVGAWEDGQAGGIYTTEETLFCKRTGEFFLHGCGGAATRWSSTARDGWQSSGEGILPLDYAAAQEWAEAHLPADRYMKFFDVQAEDDKIVHLCVSLSAATAKMVRAEAAKAGLTKSAWIEQKIIK